MTCFDSYIGLAGLGGSYTLYLDQCGITEDMLSSAFYTPYADTDLPTLVTNKLNEATNMVAKQIKMANSGRIKTLEYLVEDSIGHPSRTKTTVSAKTGYWAGAKIELVKDNDYKSIVIDTISLLVDTTGNVDVKIYDLIEGRLLNTVTVAAVSGQTVYKDVNLSFSSRKRNVALAIVYDSEFSSTQTTALDAACGSCGGTNKRQNKYAYVQGIKIADANISAPVISSILGEADTAGLGVEYAVKCNFEQWVCSNRDMFALACLYYTAYHLANYCMQSINFNSYTLDMRETVEKIMQMNLDSYNNEFNSLINNIQLPSNSDCFICNPVSTHPITL